MVQTTSDLQNRRFFDRIPVQGFFTGLLLSLIGVGLCWLISKPRDTRDQRTRWAALGAATPILVAFALGVLGGDTGQTVMTTQFLGYPSLEYYAENPVLLRAMSCEEAFAIRSESQHFRDNLHDLYQLRGSNYVGYLLDVVEIGELKRALC